MNKPSRWLEDERYENFKARTALILLAIAVIVLVYGINSLIVTL